MYMGDIISGAGLALTGAGLVVLVVSLVTRKRRRERIEETMRERY